MAALPRPEQPKAATMPSEHGRWLHDQERRSPAVPSLRQPCPEHTIDGGQAKPWTAGTIRHGQLVPKRDDLQVQCRARPNQEPKRVKHRNDDGHDEPAYSEPRATSIVTRRTAFLVGTGGPATLHSSTSHPRPVSHNSSTRGSTYNYEYALLAGERVFATDLSRDQIDENAYLKDVLDATITKL
jgi:hypothetical protein